MKIEDMEKLLIEALKTIEANKKKTTTTKRKSSKKKSKTTAKKPQQKQQPKLSYSAIPDIIENMKVEECISRFGILHNSENPYNISGKAIEKFYTDYNISAFKKWYMSYTNKDLIIDKQLSKYKNNTTKNIQARIKIIEEKLNKKYPSKTINQKDKIQNALINQMQKLEARL